jgi:exonuclease SbcC
MLSGLHIDQIHIEGFRGIAGGLDLDLTAPVTLIFAPNGTGKTTICEAIEWLLTAQVDRLRNGSSFDGELLRSVFQPEADPLVSAHLRTPSRTGVLTRTLQAASWGGGTPTLIGALLDTLAPAAAAPDANHINAIRLRQHYLRGTRFLTGEALGSLVDSDEETIGRRAQVFADLLGIRHLLDAERDSGKFVSDLGQQLRVLDGVLAQLEKEEAQLRAEIDTQDSDNQAAMTELTAAERLLGINPTGTGAADTRLQEATAAHSRAQHEWDRGDQAINALAKEWSRWRELEQRGNQLRQRETAEAEGARQRREAVEAAAAEAAKANELVNRLTEDGRRVDQARGTIRLTFAQVNDRLAVIRDRTPQLSTTYASLRKAAPEVDWTESDRSARLGDLANARAAVPRVSSATSQLGTLDEQRRALLTTAMPQADLVALAVRVRELELACSAANAELEATTGPIARLQVAGQEFAEHLHETDPADCPLCGHDFIQVATLRSAIADALALGPELVRAAQARATKAAEDARQAKALHTQAAQIYARAEALEREAGGLRTSLGRDTDLFARLGIDLSTPDLESAVAGAEDRVAFGAALAAFVAAVATHREVFGSIGARLWADHMDLDQVVADLFGRLDSRQSQVEAALLQAQSSQAICSAALLDLGGKQAVAQASLDQCRRDLAEVTRDASRLGDLWRTAASDKPRTDDGLDLLKVGHEETRNRLTAIMGSLAVGRGALGAEVRRARLEQLRGEIAPARLRRDRLRGRQEEGTALQTVFHDTYASISKEQIGGLARVVNALFSRMHANRVVDQIDLGVAEKFLRWGASAGEAKLDPGTDFSQGQRQDLALSLFLARARGLGGTFFLDEPLAHLDDLNRVGLLDVFRAVAVENASTLNLVITTASRNVARHMVEKFGSVPDTAEGLPMLRVIELVGNGRTGVSNLQAYPRAA